MPQFSERLTKINSEILAVRVAIDAMIKQRHGEGISITIIAVDSSSGDGWEACCSGSEEISTQTKANTIAAMNALADKSKAELDLLLSPAPDGTLLS